ncbi:MAG: hypothetical protein P8O06_00505, partial [Porticoccaceae bacterium]|nr:hypothetical protein [Porticoccaceae bacterium]
VPSRAAGLIEEGQVVKFQYDAFPYQRFGVFSGSVSEVATTILIPGEISLPTAVAEPFYIVDVKVHQQWVMASGKKVSLKPGMLLRADVVLEERTILQWLFDPIYAITGRL